MRWPPNGRHQGLSQQQLDQLDVGADAGIGQNGPQPRDEEVTAGRRAAQATARWTASRSAGGSSTSASGPYSSTRRTSQSMVVARNVTMTPPFPSSSQRG